jgi:tetratricopeptide (TPR) repeat protein
MTEKEMIEFFNRGLEEAVDLKRKGRYEESINKYKSLFSANPNIPQVHEGMAKVCAVIGRYNDAVQCFDLASKLYSSFGDENKAMLCSGYRELFSNPNENDREFKEIVNSLRGNDSKKQNFHSSAKKDQEGCFIATAAYGDYDNSYVLIFRNYRDDVLKKRYLGRIFISLYYKISPPIAVLIKRSEILKKITRKILLPLSSILNK